MKECNIKELKAGAVTESYIITDDFFIAVSKYHPLRNSDISRLERYDFESLYYVNRTTEEEAVSDEALKQTSSESDSDSTGSDAIVQSRKQSSISEDSVPASSGTQILEEIEESSGMEETAVSRAPEQGETEAAVEKEVYDSAVTLTMNLFNRIQRSEKITITQIYKIALLIINYVSNLKNDALTYVGRGSINERLAVHSVNTAILSTLTSVNLTLRGHELIDTVSGALLHDLGILFLKDNAGEEEVRNHTLTGYGYLRRRFKNPLLLKPALEHHEKARGNGYPYRITLDKMGLSSKIVALCDSYDNQLSFIKFGSDISIHYDKKEFLNWHREDYDIKVLSALIESVRDFAGKGSRVQLNDGSAARVVKTMLRFPLTPIITREDTGEEIDLRKIKDIWIDRRMS